ncbi:MAG: hypothetical protein OXC29_01495, partial [Rhodococcus sp.]|nr:hypothetical protein [Rhodococcus sp. (in: high G+C Gram-positive bacteria)]
MSPVVNSEGSVPPNSQYDSGAPALVARMPTSSLPAPAPGSRILFVPNHSANASSVLSSAAGSLTTIGKCSVSVMVGEVGAPAGAASPRRMRSPLSSL